MKSMCVGETVYLKSGSPRLTIAGIDGDQARVTWISDGNLQETYLPLICLIRYVFEDSGPSLAECKEKFTEPINFGIDLSKVGSIRVTAYDAAVDRAMKLRCYIIGQLKLGCPILLTSELQFRALEESIQKD